MSVVLEKLPILDMSIVQDENQFKSDLLPETKDSTVHGANSESSKVFFSRTSLHSDQMPLSMVSSDLKLNKPKGGTIIGSNNIKMPLKAVNMAKGPSLNQKADLKKPLLNPPETRPKSPIAASHKVNSSICSEQQSPLLSASSKSPGPMASFSKKEQKVSKSPIKKKSVVMGKESIQLTKKHSIN